MATLPDQVRALLDGPNYAHLATVLPDGSPHSVVVWAGTEGDQVVFFTQSGSRKARNVERDPRVALSVSDHEHPYRAAYLRGRVVGRRDGAEALAAMDRLAHKYTGRPFPFRGPHGVLYLVEVERASYVDLPFTHRPGSG